MKYKLNVRKSPLDKRDWKASAIYPKIVLPEVVDYRDEQLPIRDQGNQGSCAAMAGAAMKEWQERIDVALDEYMSPQFIYNNREDTSEEGMYMRDLMGVLRERGDSLESFCKYGSKTVSKAAYENALNFIIKNYASVDAIEELKTALYTNGPCIIAVPVYNYSTRMWKQMSGDYFLGGHAMCLVGYNTDGFIIRNSWGRGWGDGGYCIFPYEDWGLQWETWTTIDEHSSDPPEPEPKKNKFWEFIKKYWWICLFGIGLITIFALIIT